MQPNFGHLLSIVFFVCFGWLLLVILGHVLGILSETHTLLPKGAILEASQNPELMIKQFAI